MAITTKKHNEIVDYFTAKLAPHASTIEAMTFGSALGYLANLEFGDKKKTLNTSELKLTKDEIVQVVGHVLNKFKYDKLPTSI